MRRDAVREGAKDIDGSIEGRRNEEWQGRDKGSEERWSGFMERTVRISKVSNLADSSQRCIARIATLIQYSCLRPSVLHAPMLFDQVRRPQFRHIDHLSLFLPQSPTY